MSIIGYGIDIVKINKLEELLAQSGKAFEHHYLTARECHWSERSASRIQYLASRLAAKTAVLKALSIEQNLHYFWHDIEIQSLPSGAPSVVLYANCQSLAAEREVMKWLLSISHTASYAAASAIALKLSL
jgi:holo-[acyl-carrier protein] synthase